MFGKVKAGNGQQALVSPGREMRQGIALGYAKPALAAGGQHAVIQINALGGDVVFKQQLEPLAAATAEVEHGQAGLAVRQRTNKGEVNAEPLFDQFSRTSVPVFKGAVEGGGHWLTGPRGLPRWQPEAHPAAPGTGRRRCGCRRPGRRVRPCCWAARTESRRRACRQG